jgi:hypothetical protein
VGRKVWWLFPPDRLEGLKDRNGEFVFDVRELEGEGGGMKVLQEVSREGLRYWKVLKADGCRKGKSCSYRADGIIRS